MKKFARTLAAALCAVCALALFSCDNSSDTPFIPPSPDNREYSDWLFLFYCDADSNLNDGIYQNIRQAEAGLAWARNQDGSPAEGYPSMRLVVLWDGISEALKGSAKYMHPDGAVFELGADYDLKAQLENNQFNLGEE